MSDVKELAKQLSGVIGALDKLAQIEDLETDLANAKHGVEVAKSQRDEVLAEHATILTEAKNRAEQIIEAGQKAAEGFHEAAERVIEGSKERAKAELALVAQQRARFEDEIIGQRRALIELQHEVEEAKQELGDVTDQVAAAKSLHARLLDQIARIKQAI